MYQGGKSAYRPVDGAAPRFGGQAQVQRCTDGAGRAVAVKWLLPDEAGGDAKARQRFAREVARLEVLCARPDTAGWVVPLLDHGERDGRPFLVLPWIELDLARWMGGRGVRERVAAAAELCACVQRLHDVVLPDAPDGLVHRDVKPQNALVDADGALPRVAGKRAPVVLADLGGVRAVGASRSRSVMGTPEYAAPELLVGRWDRRTDVYAAGVTAVELLIGRRPRVCLAPTRPTERGLDAIEQMTSTGAAPRWVRETPLAELLELVARPPLTDAERAEVIKPFADAGHAAGGTRLATRLARALELDPAERLRDVGSLRDALDAALDDLAVPVAPTRPRERARGTVPDLTSLVQAMGAGPEQLAPQAAEAPPPPPAAPAPPPADVHRRSRWAAAGAPPPPRGGGRPG